MKKHTFLSILTVLSVLLPLSIKNINISKAYSYKSSKKSVQTQDKYIIYQKIKDIKVEKDYKNQRYNIKVSYTFEGYLVTLYKYIHIYDSNKYISYSFERRPLSEGIELRRLGLASTTIKLIYNNKVKYANLTKYNDYKTNVIYNYTFHINYSDFSRMGVITVKVLPNNRMESIKYNQIQYTTGVYKFMSYLYGDVGTYSLSEL